MNAVIDSTARIVATLPVGITGMLRSVHRVVAVLGIRIVVEIARTLRIVPRVGTVQSGSIGAVNRTRFLADVTDAIAVLLGTIRVPWDAVLQGTGCVLRHSPYAKEKRQNRMNMAYSIDSRDDKTNTIQNIRDTFD